MDRMRRNRIDMASTGETAIRAAVDVVEAMGAHPHLTAAVALLDRARDRVADFIDKAPVVLGMTDTPSDGPIHIDSLGPCPQTVAEWVEQSQRTGILEFPLLLRIAQTASDEARSHLGAALMQMLATDDQTIGQHVRDAYALLGGDPMSFHAQREILARTDGRD